MSEETRNRWSLVARPEDVRVTRSHTRSGRLSSRLQEHAAKPNGQVIIHVVTQAVPIIHVVVVVVVVVPRPFPSAPKLLTT